MARPGVLRCQVIALNVFNREGLVLSVCLAMTYSIMGVVVTSQGVLVSGEEQIGVDPGVASFTSDAAESLAGTLSDVVSRFNVATEDLATSLQAPFEDRQSSLARAYRKFAGHHVDQMWKIQNHGRQLSRNVRSAAEYAAATDEETAGFYRASHGDLPEIQNPVATEDYYGLDRYINRA